MNGHDQGGCGGSATSGSVPAVAVNDTADQTTVKTAIASNRASNYTGSGSASPDVEVATMPPSLATLSGVQSLVSTVTANATQTLTGPLTSLSNPGTSASPQNIVVNGDLTLSGNTTGYGSGKGCCVRFSFGCLPENALRRIRTRTTPIITFSNTNSRDLHHSIFLGPDSVLPQEIAQAQAATQRAFHSSSL